LNSISRSYTLLHAGVTMSFGRRTRYTKPNTRVLAPAITLNDQKSTTRDRCARLVYGLLPVNALPP